VQIEVTSRDMLYMRSLLAGNSYSQGLEILGSPGTPRGVRGGPRRPYHLFRPALKASHSHTIVAGADYAFTAGLP
jgi:hypothetical protein